MHHEPSDSNGPAECCVAGDHDSSEATLPTNPYGDTSPVTADTARMAEIPGGAFEMGTDDDVGFPADGEGPPRTVELDPFYVDRHQVTNAEFFQFAKETGCTTDAERFGWSFVFRNVTGPEAREHVLDAADGGHGGSPWRVPTGSVPRGRTPPSRTG